MKDDEMSSSRVPLSFHIAASDAHGLQNAVFGAVQPQEAWNK